MSDFTVVIKTGGTQDELFYTDEMNILYPVNFGDAMFIADNA